MKQLFSTFLFVLVLTCTNGIISAQDTEQNFYLEGGIGYGSETQSLAFQGGGLYKINESFRVSADGIYYLPGKDSRGLEFSWFEVNANASYILITNEDVTGYLLSGLNFAKLFSDEQNIRLPSGDDTDTVYVGVNVGAGAEFPVGNINLYIEGKYALSSAHQLVFTGGVRIPL